MVYPIMNPPFGAKKTRTLTAGEAKKHFDWYMSIIPERMGLLKQACQIQNWNECTFDYSIESLLHLWKWYLDNVVIVPKSEEEYKNEISKMLDYMRKNVPKEKIEIGWIQIAEDIGIYFSLCLLAYSPKLKWDLFTEPKNLDCRNNPVLSGFINGMTFYHTQIMSVKIIRILKKTSLPNDLIKTFDVWLEYIPKN